MGAGSDMVPVPVPVSASTTSTVTKRFKSSYDVHSTMEILLVPGRRSRGRDWPPALPGSRIAPHSLFNSSLSVIAVPPSSVSVALITNSPTPSFGGAGATTSQPVVKPHVRAIFLSFS